MREKTKTGTFFRGSGGRGERAGGRVGKMAPVDQFLTKPAWNVVNPDPTLSEVMRAMRPKDWWIVVGTTLASMPYGWKIGPPQFKMGYAYSAAFIGFTATSIMGWSNSYYRLLGFKDNARECEKYGVFYRVDQEETQGKGV